jgi:WD40 repeat protein
MTAQTPVRKARGKPAVPATPTNNDSDMMIVDATAIQQEQAPQEPESESTSAAGSVTVVGGSLADRPGVFCGAINAFAVPCGTTVMLVHVATGNTIRTLRGHKGRVTGVVLPPSNRYQLLTSSTDGTVKTWDLQDGACLSTISLGGRISFFGMGTSQPIDGSVDRVLYAIVDKPTRPSSTTTKSERAGPSPNGHPVQVLVRCVQKAASGKKASRVNVEVLWSAPLGPRNNTGELIGGKPVRGLSVQPSTLPESKEGHADIVAVITHHDILVWTCHMGPQVESIPVVASTLDVSKTKRNSIVSTIHLRAQLSNAAEISALAMHPTNTCLAIGDIAGRIVVHNWGGPVTQPGGLPKQHISTVLHWHSHSVAGLAFNADGHYLMSGGQEAVLVVWQLGTGKKTFLPRLGGAVGQISSDAVGSLCAVALLDNSVRLVDISALEQRWRFFGLQLVNHRIKVSVCADLGTFHFAMHVKGSDLLVTDGRLSDVCMLSIWGHCFERWTLSHLTFVRIIVVDLGHFVVQCA